MRILVKGAGVAGLAAAHELAVRGAEVTVVDPRPDFSNAASWFAGGMLAPWCERESADEAVLQYGGGAADWWAVALPGEVHRKGTLVVAPPRDVSELKRFAARTSGHEWLGEEEIAALEPALAGRFRLALFFPREAHLDPRRVLKALRDKLTAAGVRLVEEAQSEGAFDRILDCTGAARIADLGGLRGVRGEMLYLRSAEIELVRPVRLLHPRIPVYIVPRGDGLFMVGATMIEADNDGPITARSLMELLNAAYTLHPAFAEATVAETGTGVRPAFADNFPRVVTAGRTIAINGLYRHGFLLAPAMAREAAEAVFAEQPKERNFP
ncbi:glycine oxidase ThiO [Rhizobiaceae bacterium n13]|uniref:Glycine oxidase ThiO n=1 Tax=Ferirhizobium litorale TaxID=2927786 RepID=A0AAE3U451_9HYPH|nr:glycine oxidase ThiO [Fererhizobium litorale]MDI7862079.1 glycine oxidase ThiO [Fererhizobium litorale]MDI7922649.1 glycine oxidase ThiO [Fererhizobium litorale]